VPEGHRPIVVGSEIDTGGTYYIGADRIPARLVDFGSGNCGNRICRGADVYLRNEAVKN
jgi:hypothetical protein